MPGNFKFPVQTKQHCFLNVSPFAHTCTETVFASERPKLVSDFFQKHFVSIANLPCLHQPANTTASRAPSGTDPLTTGNDERGLHSQARWR